jgi:DNA-binding NarL/FixJ family response regulator
VTAPAHRVLLCDDSQTLRAVLHIVLLAEGLDVVGEAADGNAACAEAERLQPDVVVLDLSMPELDGLSALPEILRVAPRSRVVVYSGFAADVLGAEALAAGAHAYVEKGGDPTELVDAIRG